MVAHLVGLILEVAEEQQFNREKRLPGARVGSSSSPRSGKDRRLARNSVCAAPRIRTSLCDSARNLAGDSTERNLRGCRRLTIWRIRRVSKAGTSKGIDAAARNDADDNCARARRSESRRDDVEGREAAVGWWLIVPFARSRPQSRSVKVERSATAPPAPSPDRTISNDRPPNRAQP